MPDDTDSPPVTWQSPPVQPGQSQVTHVVVPTPTLESVLRRHSQQNDALWKQLRQNTANMPLDQTEAAVAAAVRFQAQRQYQENLKAGMSQNEAMAIAAPLIYGGPKQGTLGQASAFIRATQPRLNDVGGVGYSFDTKTGQWTARTPAKVTPPSRPMSSGGMLYDVTDPRNPKAVTPPPPAKKTTVRVLLDPADPEKGTITGTMDDPEIAKRVNPPIVPKPPGFFDRLWNRASSATGPTPTPPPSAAKAPASSTEVSRMTKDGRVAIFDAATKKFLRYANQ